MRITKLHARSFGKLRDHILAPAEGLNLYALPNESGKTTLIYFIYYMLYGYDAKLLKQYLPWSGEELAGSLEFTLQGRRWRIERRRPHKGLEKRQVLCLENGEEPPLSNREQPGPYFLGLDGETFLRSFCITQGELLFARTDGLDVALKNMAATGDENVSYRQAEEYLNKLHTQYRHRTRSAGRLIEQKNALARGREEEKRLSALVDERLGERRQWEALEAELAQKEQALEALRGRLMLAEKSDAIKLLRRLDALKALPKAEKPAVEKEALSALEQAFAQQGQAKSTLAAAAAAAERSQAELNALGSARPGLLPILLLALGVAAGILGAAISLWPCYIAAGVLALSALALYLAKSSAHSAERKRLERDLAADKAAEGRAKAAAETAETALEALRIRHRIMNTEELRSMQIAWGVYESTATEDTIALQEQAILAGRSRAALEALAEGGEELEETADALRSRLLSEEQTREELRRRRDALNRSDLQRLWEDLSAQKHANEQLAEEISEGEQRLAAIQQSLLWLKEANEEMNTHFAPKLCALAGKHLSALTGGKYSGLLMDDRFSIRLETAEGTYPAEHFSAGTRDAIYFSFRLAAGEMLSEEPLPMVLDDPFTNLDNDRRAAAEQLLKRAAEERQILYFTCREER